MHSHERAKANEAGGSAPSRNSDALQPLALPLSKAVAVTGLSRSAIYRAAGEGKITLLKAGRTTLVCMASVRAFLAGLPRAVVGRGQPAP